MTQLSWLRLSFFALALLLISGEARAACSATAAAWANRDDDGDGICNGVDDCPYESDPAQAKAANGGGAACQVQAITVPWVPTNTALPHITYSGRAVTLKGIARYAGSGATFRWDFGDGASTAYATYVDPYNLGVLHTYTGNVNQLFIATLYVKNSAGTFSTSTYPVQIYTSTDVTDPNQMDVRVAVAEDEALWNMHVNMVRDQYADGATGYFQRYGYWASDQVGTCASIDALQLHGSKPLQPYSTDPYVEDSQRGLAYILYNTTIINVSGASPNPIPVNSSGTALGDTWGVQWAGGSIYSEGICGVAFASAGSPGRVAQDGPSGVFNQTYGRIAQDSVDWFAWGQNDGSSYYSGGWLYSANSGGADGSTNQWPILAMGAMEQNMGATIPTFVRAQTPYFMNSMHNLAAGSYYGGYGYTSGAQYPNMAKTAGGIMANFFIGNSNSHPDVAAGWGFIYTRWTVPANSWTDYNLGNSYAMYDVMKATQQANPKVTRIYALSTNSGSACCANGVGSAYAAGSPTTTSFDWYYTPSGQTQQGLATNVINRQVLTAGATYGSFPDDPTQNVQGISSRLSTAWDTLILMKAVANVPPKAVICNCSAQWPSNSPITLDGSCSIEPDASKSILNPAGYKWDYVYTGGTFIQSVDSNNFPVQGPVVVKPDGFFQYTVDGNGNPTAFTHTVALQVTDNTPVSQGGPQSNITTCNVIIKPPPHCPQASIGGPYIGFVNAPVQLTAAGSTQVDGDPLTYAWDFSNANVFGDSTVVNPTHTWTTNGTYPIELRVTNHPPSTDAGVVPSCTVTAYTTVTIGTHAPVASAGGPYTATQGETITLDGSGSYDPDGNAFTYAWDLTGNGLYTDSTIQKPSYTVLASTAIGASFSVCLRVSDINKTSSPACATVTTIAHHQPPTCVIAPVAVQSCTGGTVPIAIDGSHSTDPNGDHFTFAWTSSNCPAFSNSTASIPTMSFPTALGGSGWEPASPGPVCQPSCTATLTVTNTYGSNSCNQLISFADLLTPTFSAAPVATTIECNANATANVNAWLATPAGGDLCTPPQSPTVITNSFRAVGGACGGLGTSGGTGGTTSVTFTATDPCNNNYVQSTATITVSDTQPPVMTLPANISVEATSAAGATVTYTATALDAATGVTPVICSQSSGTTFAVGVTTVTCTSTDVGGHKATGSFTVTITDKTAPALTLPANLTVEATSAAGAIGTFTATASDIVDGSVTPVCVPASESTFALGTTPVTCAATDRHNNASSGTFTVTVRDTTVPVVTGPGNLTFEATSAAGAVATFTATATDTVTSGLSVSCVPASGTTFAIGTTHVTCSATDVAGNTGRNQFNVTVRDTTAPTIMVPANQILEATSAAGAAYTFSPGVTATDIVDGATAVSCVPASGTTFAIGTTTVTCMTADAHANPSSQSFTVTVRDTTAPTLTVPANMIVESTGPAGAVATFTATATDAVDPSPVVACLPASRSTFALGVTTVSCSATDKYTNKNTKTFTVTVQDTTGPTLTMPVDQTLEATSAAGAVATFTATATDIVSGVTAVSCVPASGSTFAIKTTLVTCTSSDVAHNSSSGTFNITVRDTTAPAVTVPANKIVEATSAAGATVSFVSTSSDIVDGALAVTCAPASGSTFAIGLSTVSCSATDAHGNKGTNSFTITVRDTTAPVVTVPLNQIAEATSAGGAAVSFASTASDAVDGAPAVTCAPVSGTAFVIGTTTVTCTATDAHTNQGTASFTVTVRDTTAPSITVPANLTLESTGPAGAVATFTSTATDAVDGAPAVTCAPVSGSTFALGTTTVTCSSTDAHHNTASKTFTVTVQDTTGPTLSLPANQVVEASSAAGAVSTFTATASDLVSGSMAVACVPASGSTFAIGITTVTCSTSDVAHNSSSGTFTVQVRDTTAPLVTVPANKIVEATSANGATVSFVSTASDAVDGSPAVTCVAASGSTFALGVTTVTCSSTDAHGNKGTSSFTITVRDTTAPAVTVPANQIAEATAANGAAVSFVSTATDAVDGVPVVTCAPVSGSTFAIGTTPVTCTSIDAHGNKGSASFTVTVQDTTAPSITVPPDFTVEATSAAGAKVNYNATATDAVDGVSSVTCVPVSGATFGLGTTKVSCSSTDAHHNTATKSFNVTVQSTTAPSLTLPANLTLEAASAAGAVGTFTATATDIVDGNVTAVCTPASGTTFALGTTIVSCTATDKHNNTSSGTFSVKVQDTTAPAVTVPANITLEATSGAGAVATFTSTVHDAVTSNLSVTCAPASGSTFALGTTRVTCSSTDAANNTGSSSFNVTVQDTTAPSITTPANQIFEATSAVGASYTFAATASDLVDGSDVVTCTPGSGSSFPIGTTTVSCVAIDSYANRATKTFTVKVLDTTAPELTVPANISLESTSPAGAVATFTASATDVVDGSPAVTCTPGSGSTFALGVTTVSCSSTDAHGNKATKTFTVTVQDTTGPKLTMPADQTLEATSAAGATATFSATASDTVSGSTAVTCLPASGTTFAIKTTLVTCTSQDAQHNSSSATFNVTVTDTMAPVVNVPANKTVEATSANGAAVTFTSTATDAVDGAPAVTCAPASGSTFALGSTPVSCSATDAHGNKGLSSFTVTVQDSTAPVVSVPGNLVFEATSASGAVVTFASSASDVVNGSTPVFCAPASGGTFAIGVTSVTCTSTDGSSNKGTASFTITVQDTTAPELYVPANLVVEATKPAGATVTYSVTATDAVNVSPAVSCSPASGTVFAIGAATVTCSSSDAHHNTATKSFTVTVQDTTPPELSVPQDLVVEATGAAGAVVNFASSASDLVSLATPVSCVPASGSTFPLGHTTVTCTSSDSHHNTATKTFRVLVGNTTAPTILVPDAVIAEATGPGGAVEEFMTSAVDVVDGYLRANCVPASGSMFAIGTTTVTCSATDSSANTGSASFTVTVTDDTPPRLTGAAQGGLLTVEATGPGGATVVDYDVKAMDLVDGALAVRCSPALPMVLPLGKTPVVCTSTDLHGNVGRLMFSVAVVDTTPPALTCPADISVAANGPLGAANWNVTEPTSDSLQAFLKGATATDLVDPLPVLSNSAPWMFPAGSTTAVTFTGTDAHGNAASCTSHVTVYKENDTAPTLSCPVGTTIAQSSWADMDWSSVFHHPVRVQLLVVTQAQGAKGLPFSLSEGGDRTMQLSSSALAAGGYAVRIRATDEFTGMAIDCNQFISVQTDSVQSNGGKRVARSSIPAMPIR